MQTLLKANDDNDLQALLISIEPKIRRAFIEVINALKVQSTLDEIVAMLQQGRVEDAIRLIEKHITVFTSSVLSFHTIAGQVAASSLSNLLGVVIGFDQTNYRAVRAMQQSRLELVSRFSQDQRAVIREILTRGITQGTNPRQTAVELRNAIGLTERQWEAVNNYRRLLEESSNEAFRRALRDRRFDSTVANAVNNPERGLTQSQIDRMVERYAERQLDYRAQTIARTESLRAVNQGHQELLAQAVDSGDLNPNEVILEWITAHDERVRSSHSPMDGQKRKMGERFISGDGNSLAYPGDPSAPASEVINCRCVLTTRLTSIQEETTNGS